MSASLLENFHLNSISIKAKNEISFSPFLWVSLFPWLAWNYVNHADLPQISSSRTLYINLLLVGGSGQRDGSMVKNTWFLAPTLHCSQLPLTPLPADLIISLASVAHALTCLYIRVDTHNVFFKLFYFNFRHIFLYR